MLLTLMLLLLCPVAFADQAPPTSKSGFPIDGVPLPTSTVPNDLVSLESSEETNSSKNSQNPQICIQKNSRNEATPKNCSNTSQKFQSSSSKNFGIEYLKKNQSGGDQDSEDSNHEDREGSTSEDHSRLQSFLQLVIVASAVLGLIVVNRLFRRPTERNATTEFESRTSTPRTIAGPPATAFSYVMQLLDAHPEICRLCLLVALYFWPRINWWLGLIVWFMLFQFW